VSPSLLQRWLLSSVAGAAVVGLAGCATVGGGPKTGACVVSSLRAEFYKYGPAQSFGPDLMLKKGDRVTMLERSWGFSKVLTENGVAGYVASEDLEVVPATAPTRFAAVGRRVPGAAVSAGGMSPSRQNRIRNEVLGDPGDPLFNVNDVPLPLPDDVPSGGARPQFRTTQPAPPDAGAKPKPRFR